MTATQQLIDLAERLRPTGEIGDGMVAQFHDLARRARAEQQGFDFPAFAAQATVRAQFESECG